MKKIITLLVAACSTFALASCGGSDTPTVKELVSNVSGGTADQREAIQTCVKKSIAQISNTTTVLIGGSYDLSEDNGDYLSLATTWATKVTSGKKYDVYIDWDVSSSAFVRSVTDSDATHKMVEFNYPGQGGQDGTYTFSIRSMSCGEASTMDPKVSYTCNVKKATYKHYDVSIDDVNKVVDIGDGKYGYDIVDYSDSKHVWFKQQPENVDKGDKSGYYYVNCTGKLIYATPDGNWGLIADGDSIMEIYAGSMYNIKESRYPAMKDKYITVVGNMAHYYGNLQIGYITEMKSANTTDLKNGEPSGLHKVMTANDFAAIKNEFGGHSQCVNGANLSNALVSVNATYVAGSLKGSDGKATTKDKLASSARFTFDVKVKGVDCADEVITIAYDYHVDKDGSQNVFANISKVIDSTSEFVLKGTLRYSGDDSNGFVQTSTIPGAWQIAPFLSDHIVLN